MLSETTQVQPAQRNMREAAATMKAAMLAMPQVDIPVEHTFGPGFYARTIRIKAGQTLVGRAHKTEHIFAISDGQIALATDDGPVIVSAPYQAVCPPGIERIGHAVTDVVCSNIHLTTETDLVKLEAALVEPLSIGHSSAEVLEGR